MQTGMNFASKGFELGLSLTQPRAAPQMGAIQG